MTGKFTFSNEVRRDGVPWGSLSWLSTPTMTEAKALVAVEVTFDPRGGHSFHKHPNQEELIYVLEGEIEQWVDRESRVLGPGDSAFIGADVVHASFNLGGGSARILAILGPSVGEEGYELVDVSGEEPWASLR